jgi:hypothetical protein
MAVTPAHTERPAPETHYDTVVRALQWGWVTPVLGAGASLCGRPKCIADEWIGNYPPNSRELSEYLAKSFHYPAGEYGGGSSPDLLHVSQWIYAMKGGSGPIYGMLHELFKVEFPHTPLHDFLAEAPGFLREKGLLRKPPLILTTNYDDLMEAALEASGEPFDLVVYMAEGPHEGMFCHRPPDGPLQPISDPQTNVEIDPDQRTVVLKIHGFVNRQDANDDSYVITEDHYIEYLTRTDLDSLIPVKVLQRLRNCHFLFLGYSLRDWNLRAMLSRLYAERLKDWDWWAIQVNPDPLEQKSWERRRVEIFDYELSDYIELLRASFYAELAG